MKTIKEWRIGDWCEVVATIEYTKYRDKRFPKRLELKSPMVGQVCGVKGRVAGDIDWGSYDEPTTFYPKANGHEWLLQVRLGMTNKPIECRTEDARPIEPPESGLPWRHQAQPPWPERALETLRDEMKDWPRDEKGRFLPANSAPKQCP